MPGAALRIGDGLVEMDRRKIARSYLRGWFFIDSVSSIPFDTMETWSGSDFPSILKLNKVRLHDGYIPVT